ncbi:MAG: hypothetical protein LBK47_02710 [Prevotellaceae bacterium]|jgi:hypothetical protein|nr:hypothetical protein [Prevotellaceae bacterium]
MKRTFLSAFFALASVALVAQDPIAMGVKIPQNTILSEQAQQVLTNKLQQLATLNNVGSQDSEARYVLVPQVSITQSEITPTAPPQQLVKLNVVIMIVENDRLKAVVAQTELNNNGVGKNEAAAILNALQQIDVRSPALKKFMELGKKKIAKLPPATVKPSYPED